jgi:EpsI family protein
MTMTGRFWMMIAVLLVASIGLRHLSHGEAVPLAQPLSNFPVQVESWHAREVPIEPRIIQALGVSDHVNRLYEAPGHPSIYLYVGYYKSQRTGQLIHSPKNCLPGAGWEPVSVGSVELTGPKGNRVSVNRYVIQNGLQRQLVLYWYQSHDRIIASEYWDKVYMVMDAIRLNRTDAALVRISTPITSKDEYASGKGAIAFAEEFITKSEGVLPN